MIRRVTNFAVAVSLVLSAAVAALWVRSYRVVDRVEVRAAHVRRDAAGLSYGQYGGVSGWGSCSVWVVPHRETLGPGVATRIRATGWGYERTRTADVGPLDWRTGLELLVRVRVQGEGRRGVGVDFPHSVAAAVFAVGPGLWWWRRARRRGRVARGMCVECGYDLRGSPGGCPECGAGVG